MKVTAQRILAALWECSDEKAFISKDWDDKGDLSAVYFEGILNLEVMATVLSAQQGNAATVQ